MPKKEPKLDITKRRIKKLAEENADDLKVSKKRPSKKIIFIEIDEEITTIFEKLKPLKIKNIYLVVPKRALLFQSIINLKILKRKAEDLHLNVSIITQDLNGISLATRIGIKVYDKPEGHEHPSLVTGKFADSDHISPLKASVNSIDQATPSRRTERKFSISELIRKGAKGFMISPKNHQNLSKKGQKKKSEKGGLVVIAPNRQALISLMVISLILLLTITYIALPGATVYLTPKSNVLKVTANVVLADYERNKAELDTRPARQIASYTFTSKIDKVFTYQATGQEFQGSSAKGIVTVKNLSNSDWPLLPKTRFQTAEGLVFRIQNQVTVPAAKGVTAGTLNVEVTADPVDVFNQGIGQRGNLAQPTKFFLPALSADNQKRIYAESTEAFTGGISKAQKFISKQDIEAARAKMTSDLKASVPAELQSSIDKRNRSDKTNLALLKDEYNLGDALVIIPPNLEGQKLESFDVKGSMVASGVAYSKDELLNILKTELKLKKNPEKRLVKIDEDSITFKVADYDREAKKIKITPTIQGIEEFEVNPEKGNGERLIKTIKDHIVGKDTKEALNFIQNLPEIERVTINSWPAWAPNMPSVPDNIKIEIKHDESVE